MKRLAILLVVGSLFCAIAAEAQTISGRIIGVVRDESGAVLPGVTATLTSPALPGGPVNVVTNEQGEYRFTQLDPGIYALNIALPGFTSYEEKDLRVVGGGTTERNVSLKVAAVAETITVSGQAPVVDPRQTGITQALPAQVMADVPHKRYGVQSFMATLPGVTTTNYDRPFQIIVMGSNQFESSYLFDGVMSNHPGSGGSWTLSDFDGLEEVNVQTLGASAEFQQAQGGVVNAIGKSGTNRFQADASAFWVPDALSTQPIKLPCGCPEGETGYNWIKFRDISTHAGGPVVRNRAWFFGGFVFRGNYARVPGEPKAAPENQYLVWLEDTNVKGTWKVNDRFTFRQTYYHERFWEPLPHFPTLTTPLEAIQLSWGYLPQSGSEITATLNNTTVFTARYALTYFPDERRGFHKSLTTPIRIDNITGVQTGNASAFKSYPRRDEVDVKLTKYLSAARANHNIGLGAQFIKNSYLQYDLQPGGVVYLDLLGVPDQAQFSPASTLAASYNGQAFWAEDEINVGQRLTMKFGVRVDRMEGISQDVDQVDTAFNKTGRTIDGLGSMFTWTQASPRGGINLKLTNDDKTVLRANVGRYYRPIIVNDFRDIHPGVAITTLARYNPITRAYDQIISVTDPRANLTVDPDMDAPYTDQYSIGIDRELLANLGFSVSYVRKNAKNQIGWKDIGGIYGTSTVVVPATGQTLTVHPLLNSPSARKFQRTNGPGFFSRYNGLILSLTRRYANRWMATVGYSYSVSEGLQPLGNLGRDPNDLTNLEGRIDPLDRPHVFTLFGSYEVPKIEVQVSGNLAAVSGTPFAPQAQIALPQGRRAINLDVPGSYRTPDETFLQFRVTKILFRRATRRVELTAEVRNALQETGSRSISSRVITSPNFGKPASWPEPRQMMFLGKVFF